MNKIFPFSQVMILAAGRGVRMGALTATTPKPLIAVHGRPILDYILDDVAGLGVREVVMNVHYLGSTMQLYCSERARHQPSAPKIIISDESDLLRETGGGVKHALPLLTGDPLLILNSDVLWEGGLRTCLAQMAAQWDDDKMDGLLLLAPMRLTHGFDGAGDYAMDDTGRLHRKNPAAQSSQAKTADLFAYAGAQIIRRAFFEKEPEVVFRNTKLWDAAEHQQRLFGYCHQAAWFHIGTPEGLEQAEQLLDSQVGG